MMAKTAAVIATLNVSVRFVRSATTAPPNSPNSGVRNNPEEGRLYGDEAFRAASGQAQKVHLKRKSYALPKAQNCATSLCNYSRDSRSAKRGLGLKAAVCFVPKADIIPPKETFAHSRSKRGGRPTGQGHLSRGEPIISGFAMNFPTGEPVSRSQSAPYTPMMGPSGRKLPLRPNTGE